MLMLKLEVKKWGDASFKWKWDGDAAEKLLFMRRTKKRNQTHWLILQGVTQRCDKVSE